MTKKMAPYLVYGWRVSYYTGKILSYLNFKNIPHELKIMNAYNLIYQAPKKVGATVMPIVVTPSGEWMQDTRDMIDHFETLYPTPSVFPEDPVERFVSSLLEAWTDEFWMTPGMYYRWHYNESIKFFKNEAMENLFPGFMPGFIKGYVADQIAESLKSYLPAVGIRPEQYEIIDLWTKDILKKLETHFSQHAYLLGNRQPTIGDFGLAGPLVPHLCRDPYPRDNLMPNYPKVVDWAKRIQGNTSPAAMGEPPNDEKNGNCSSQIPETLIPIVKTIFEEFLPLMNSTNQELLKLATNPKFTTANAKGVKKSLPRALDDIHFPVLQNQYQFYRRALPFNLWKFQHVLDEYVKDKKSIDEWIVKNRLPNHEMLKNMQIPPMKRSALSVKFA
jgi:glutathione S-transferase